MPLRVDDFAYELPEALIAQEPPPERGSSRMLVMQRHNGACELRNFSDIIDYLDPGDCLVMNNTRVIPARLYGRRKDSGGRVEALLLRELSPGRWNCLLRPGRRLRSGAVVEFAGSDDNGTETASFKVHKHLADGSFTVDFTPVAVLPLLEKLGRMPLPPYIRRDAAAADRERYQTVYASQLGAVAAPTAGLHFTPETLANLQRKGIETAQLTLHVGAGTFKPVEAETAEEHVMHEEVYVLPAETAAKVNTARECGKRVVAVGTTSVRVLETRAVADTGRVTPGSGTTDLFMYPPRQPAVVDALLTNFHLPRSTLLMLVSCFSSREHVMHAYTLAIREKMRFYSYGDCMLLI